ncbi:MAG: L,D-transpeptidase [Bacillales bacterium]|nr:L,D-transpeptidase [Bacillales bacterium]
MLNNLILSLIISFSSMWPIGNSYYRDEFIIINKKTNGLVFIDDGKIVFAKTVATGKTSDLTPEGEFLVTVKAVNPYDRRRNIAGGDVLNPLGSRWIGFDALNTDGRIYGIHGTNVPWSIGSYASNGCIRMLNNEVENLYNLVPVGTKVIIVNTDMSFEEIAESKDLIK